MAAVKATFTILHKDAGSRRVFGWFSVAKTSAGKTLIDRQGDVIEVAELEMAAAEFMKEFRQGGLNHSGGAPNKLIASLVFTNEVQKALGLAPGTLPEGWFGGFEIPEATFAKVSTGKLAMFSIEGECETEQIEVDETTAERAA